LPTSNIDEISYELEENYDRITTHLNVGAIPQIAVKIWTDYDEFLIDMEDDIGTIYNGATGYIYSNTELRLFYNSLTPTAAVHEFSHIVSMYVNPTIPNNPRWLWEAVALYETGEFVDPKTLRYMVEGDYPTLDELNTTYNNSNHKIYSVGYVLLEYIIFEGEMDLVLNLIENNGDIKLSMGMEVSQFEQGWYNFLEEKYLN
jgi:hypothetical protein